MKDPQQWIDVSRRQHENSEMVFVYGVFDEDRIRAIQNDALEAAAMLLHENIELDGDPMLVVIRYRDAIRRLKEPNQ